MLVFTLRMAEILLSAPVWSGQSTRERMVNTCVCVMCLCLQFKGFLCVHMFAPSQWGENHCVLGEPACARVYSKVDYVFGSVLLTITKSFCFGENSTRKPVSLLSLCRRSASINPIAKWRKRLFFSLWCWLMALEVQVVRIKRPDYINKNGGTKGKMGLFSIQKTSLFFSCLKIINNKIKTFAPDQMWNVICLHMMASKVWLLFGTKHSSSTLL